MKNKVKNKNQLIVVGLLAGFAIFGSTSSQAAQTCQEMQGELHMISVEGENRHHIPKTANINDEISKIEQENLIRLDERAKMICSNYKYCIDERSIESKVRVIDHFVTRIYIQTTAAVNCLA